MRYDDKEVLRERYILLMLAQSGRYDISEKHLKNLKKKIRNMLHEEEEDKYLNTAYYWEEDHWVADKKWSAKKVNQFRFDMDGGVFKYKLPSVITTKEKAEDYYNEFIRKTYIDRGYDCTGQAFSCRHVIFYNVNENRFYCYECVAYDV